MKKFTAVAFVVGFIAGAIIAGLVVSYKKDHKIVVDENVTMDGKMKRSASPFKPFWEVTKLSVAHKNMDTFARADAFNRLYNDNRGKTLCIAHDYESQLLIDTVLLKEFIATHKVKAGYRWAVGYYPHIDTKVFNGTSCERLGLYLIPTMVQGKDTMIVLDYNKIRNTADTQYYRQKRWIDEKGVAQYRDNDEFYIYDQGTIFP